MPRTMLTMHVGPGRFNVRVAGIALREGHVLVHRLEGDDYWALPGGRVEFGEDSAEALAREMREELGTEVDVKRLLFFAENFFSLNGLEFHEFALFYEMRPPVDFRTDFGATFWLEEDGRSYEFCWSKVDEESLAMLPLLPAFLQTRLSALPNAPEHIVWRDREGSSAG